MITREEDAIRLLAAADTHDELLFFTNRGRVFRAKCYEIPPDSSRRAKGMAVVNLFPIAEGEKVTAMVVVSDYKMDTYLVMATRDGEVKRTAMKNFASVRSSGLIAMDLEKGDELVTARICIGSDDLVLVTAKGQSIKFAVSELRVSSRTSGGVRGVRLASSDQVVGMDIIYPEAFLLVITTRGYGKLTAVDEYPRQHRAGSGVRTFKVLEKTGDVVAAGLISRSHQLMIMSADGNVIRTPVKGKDNRKGIAVQGRSTQGVRLMRLKGGDKVVSITCLD
jgi:DNA gyrase subunit A